ncbi:hypothetical protein PFISCL1PPCAC_18873, partial [Pristionchus fissidentatus]
MLAHFLNGHRSFETRFQLFHHLKIVKSRRGRGVREHAAHAGRVAGAVVADTRRIHVNDTERTVEGIARTKTLRHHLVDIFYTQHLVLHKIPRFSEKRELQSIHSESNHFLLQTNWRLNTF